MASDENEGTTIDAVPTINKNNKNNNNNNNVTTTNNVALTEEDDISSSISSSPSSNPSNPSSISSTPSLLQESTASSDSPVEFSEAVQTMARMRFLASQWKRRSLSGNANFRSSREVRTHHDTLDHCPSADVAMEVEAIKLEVQDTHSEESIDETLASTCSFPSSADEPAASDSDGPQHHDHHQLRASDRMATSKSKRGSFFHRAKRALGISSDEIVVVPKDHPVSIFNDNKPGEAISKLVSSGVLENTPAAVAEFFHVNDSVNKFKVGDYLGTLNDFNIKVLHELVKRFDFSKMDFDIALRHLLYCFRLPGEAQKINRIMDAFGSHFFNSCTNSVFVNADAAQVMAFSAIMLTTDAHNPRVLEKMTKPQFITLTRGMNGDGNFPKDFLEYMFEKVVDEPLIRIDHTTTLMPYAAKRGWVHLPRRRSWKRYYALLFEGSIYLQRKPMESKWRKRIIDVKLVSPDLQQIANAPTQHCVAITGLGEGVEAAYLAADSLRDIQGWINVLQ